MKQEINPNSLPLRQHVHVANKEFLELFCRRIKKVNSLIAKHNAAFAADPKNEVEHNKAVIYAGQETGMLQALRLYDDANDGVLKVEDRELQRVIFQIRAQIRSRISQFTAKACEQAHLVWTLPSDNPRHQRAKLAALKLHGQIEGYQYTLEYFDKHFNEVEDRACLV